METGFKKVTARAFAVVMAAAVALSCAGAPPAHAATLAAVDFGAGGKVVASYIKGDAGNKREFRCTRKVTALSSSDPKVVSVRANKAGYGFDVELRKPGKAKITHELDGSRKAVALKAGSKDYAEKLKKLYSGFSECNSLKVRNGTELGGPLNMPVLLKNSKTCLVETIELWNGHSARRWRGGKTGRLS